ncbi:hypothetical protein KY330_04355 [Candidatus Woesearchaeota archaeon]|nr:hypothetical protein [Candidatus Woesearchaeota archaeon]
MGYTIPVITSQNMPIIRFKGIFDFDGLYKLMVKWFQDRLYIFQEPTYKDKAGSDGREVEISWESEKKISDFYEYHITVDFHLWDMQPVEVILEGEKRILTKARMEIVIKSYVVADYQNRWERTAFTSALLNFYFSYIVGRRMGATIWDPLYYRSYKLHTLIKDFLKLESRGSAY